MDARRFKAPYLRRTDIWKQADELRERLLPQGTWPVPVLDLAEFDLGLELDPRPTCAAPATLTPFCWAT